MRGWGSARRTGTSSSATSGPRSTSSTFPMPSGATSSRSSTPCERASSRSSAVGEELSQCSGDKEIVMSQALQELLTRQVARFNDRQGDWDAFADARVEGYRRAQHRFIGSGASGKADANVIPAEHFTLSVMFIPPGQGDAAGNRAETVLGPWDCVSCPANVIHGFVNVGLEPAYLQVMLGKARPELMTYSDPSLQARRDEHLGAARRNA